MYKRQGDERIRQSLLTLSSVPDGIGAIGGIAANDEIERISRQHVDSAKGLATTAGALATTTLTALTAREREGGELAADARRTRDVLEEQVARELHGRVQSGDLSALRQDLARVRDRAQELYRIPERMPAQDRDLRLRIEYHAGQALSLIHIWDNYGALLLVLSLLSVEWMWRKRVGLP